MNWVRLLWDDDVDESRHGRAMTTSKRAAFETGVVAASGREIPPVRAAPEDEPHAGDGLRGAYRSNGPIRRRLRATQTRARAPRRRPDALRSSSQRIRTPLIFEQPLNGFQVATHHPIAFLFAAPS